MDQYNGSHGLTKFVTLSIKPQMLEDKTTSSLVKSKVVMVKPKHCLPANPSALASSSSCQFLKHSMT